MISTHKEQFLIDLNEAIEMERSPLFRERVYSLLERYSLKFSFYMSSSIGEKPEQAYIFSLFATIRRKIESERYAVTHFQLKKNGIRIPVLEIISKDVDSETFVLPEVPSNPPMNRSKEDLDALVYAFSQMNLPWEVSEDCYGFAEVLCRLLRTMNIPEEKIKKIWIETERDDFQVISSQGKLANWRWHTAPLVTIESGESFVIDLFFNGSKALSVSDWIRLVGGNQSFQIGQVSCRSTCDMHKRREVFVTDEIFSVFLKRIDAHNFISKLPYSGSIKNSFLMTIFPSYPNLHLEPALRALESSPFLRDSDKNQSLTCIIS